MILFKFLLVVLLVFSFHDSQLQAYDRAQSKIELELTHTLLRTKQTKDNKLFFYQLNLASKQTLTAEEFKLIVINCTGQPKGHTKVWFDNDEKTWIYDNGKDHLLDEFEIAFGNFSDGEFVDLIIVDDEKQILAGTHICPKPIECRASDGAILSLQLHSPNGEQYVLKGYGFKPDENLSLMSQSEDEIIPYSALYASNEGNFTAGISPQVVGKSFGNASLSLRRQDGTQLKLSYLWGITEEKLAALDTEREKIGV